MVVVPKQITSKIIFSCECLIAKKNLIIFFAFAHNFFLTAFTTKSFLLLQLAPHFSHTQLSLSLSLSLSLILYGTPLYSFSSKRLHATLLVNVSQLKKISLSPLLSHTQFLLTAFTTKSFLSLQLAPNFSHTQLSLSLILYGTPLYSFSSKRLHTTLLN